MTMPSNVDRAERKRKSEEVSRALIGRIRHYFEVEAPHSEAIRLTMEATPVAAYEPERGIVYALTFTLPEGHGLEGLLRLDHTGGNMYALEASLGDASESFSLSLEDPSRAPDSTCADTLCTFLLKEIERLAGEVYLREATDAEQDT